MADPITAAQRDRILELRNRRTGREIAKMVGVSTAIVSLVLGGKHQPTIVGSLPPPDESLSSTQKKLAKKDIEQPAPTDIPDAIPETADLELVDKWIAIVEAAATEAREDENMSAFASITAKLVALLEHRRKVAPIPKEDPNANPDMIELGNQVWERLKRAVIA